jgi:transcriptional regulator with XRE-family HTH domain
VLVLTKEVLMAARKLGDVVRELRERRALTQVDLADRAQVGVSYVTTLEAGQQANPPAAILQRLARALSVHVDRLRAT